MCALCIGYPYSVRDALADAIVHQIARYGDGVAHGGENDHADGLRLCITVNFDDSHQHKLTVGFGVGIPDSSCDSVVIEARNSDKLALHPCIQYSIRHSDVVVERRLNPSGHSEPDGVLLAIRLVLGVVVAVRDDHGVPVSCKDEHGDPIIVKVSNAYSHRLAGGNFDAVRHRYIRADVDVHRRCHWHYIICGHPKRGDFPIVHVSSVPAEPSAHTQWT